MLNLLPHNVKSYKSIVDGYNAGIDILSIVHATGTGKTFNALQLILDNPDKKFVFVTPYLSIIEHITSIINNLRSNYGVGLFSNVEFYTYNAIAKMDNSELNKVNMDYLILDEFHHIGAPVWGDKIKELIALNKGVKVLGISAYTVRDRGTIYERDVVAPESDELFAGSVVSRYDLIDAMIDGILPTPIYRSTHVNMEKYIKKIEGMINKNNLSEVEYNKLQKKLDDFKKNVVGKNEAKELFLKNIKKDGKYIYFCPVMVRDGINDIESIMFEVKSWLLSFGFSENDFIFYKSTSKDIEDGRKNRNAFYYDRDLDGNDVSGKLQIMFAINQYNEGVHVPSVDGVILGRETKSDIVFFEQIGRALSVAGDLKQRKIELGMLPLSDLQEMARCKGIICNYNSKKQLIKKLLSPVIIDFADNIEYINELENSYKIRYEKRKTGIMKSSKVFDDIDEDVTFDIVINYHDIFNELKELQARFENYTWDESYELAKNYYAYHKNLEVPRQFRTDDGINYDCYGYRLGHWIAEMRRTKSSLPDKKVKKLERIGMVWKVNFTWDESFAILKKIAKKDGIDSVGAGTVCDGANIGTWLNQQRYFYRIGMLKEDRIKKLESLNIRWSFIKSWDESYQLLVNYYNENGHANLPYNYKTSDGYNLYDWLKYQKIDNRNGELSKDKKSKLLDLGCDLSIKEVKSPLTMDEYKIVLKEYYDEIKSLKATRGVLYESKLFNRSVDIARIVARVKRKKDKGKLSPEDIAFYEGLEIKWVSFVPKSWDESYAYAVLFYEEYGHLNVPTTYKADDGYDLGNWIYLQRREKDNLEPKKVLLLEKIDMIWERNCERKKVLDVIDVNGMDYKTNKNILKGIGLFEIKAKVKYLLENGIEINTEEGLHEIFSVDSADLINLIGMDYHTLLVKYLSRKDKIAYMKSLKK